MIADQSPASSPQNVIRISGDVHETVSLPALTPTSRYEILALCQRFAKRQAAADRRNRRPNMIDTVGSNNFCRQFRILRRHLHRSFRWYRKTTLTSIASMMEASMLAGRIQAQGPFQTAQQSFSRHECRSLEKLNRTYAAAHSRERQAGSSPQVRQGLEQEMFELFAQFHASGVTFADNSNRVLCVHKVSRPGSPDPVLRFYLQSCALREDNWFAIANIPRWLFDLLTVHEYLFTTKAADIGLPDVGKSIFNFGHEALTTSCVPLPSSVVLESALELWSSRPDDVYHDIAAAITAAEMLI